MYIKPLSLTRHLFGAKEEMWGKTMSCLLRMSFKTQVLLTSRARSAVLLVTLKTRDCSHVQKHTPHFNLVAHQLRNLCFFDETEMAMKLGELSPNSTAALLYYSSFDRY